MKEKKEKKNGKKRWKTKEKKGKKGRKEERKERNRGETWFFSAQVLRLDITSLTNFLKGKGKEGKVVVILLLSSFQTSSLSLDKHQ